MKKLLLSLLFALVALTGLQAQTIWDGTADTEWYNATSTKFEISTAEQLAGLAKLVNNGKNFRDKTILLTADIVLNDTSNWENWESSAPENTWTPIGLDWGIKFFGTFDGQGHTVSGIYINSENDYQGLFGYNEGTIKNIGVTESYIKGEYSVGGVCGRNDAGTISNCYNSGTVNGNSYVGGVCGYNYGTGTISNCYNSGTVSGTGESNSNVGGVCGLNNGTISNCYNSGEVSGNSYIGGVCGHNGDGGTISNCYNTGNLSGNYKVGGACGNNGGGTISNCYNSGNVNGTGESNSNVGGICGYNGYDYDSAISNCYNTGNVNGTGESNSNVGGICGHNWGTISDCYNTGNLSGNYKVGGACGNNGGSISNCYYLDNSSYNWTDNDLTGENFAKAKSAEQFASGEVCWLLNGKSDANPTWFQTLGTDNAPLFDNTHGTVYSISNCPNSATYNNNGPSNIRDHSDSDNDGRCDFCGQIILSEPAQSNGIYQIGNRAELYWYAGLVNGSLDGIKQNREANAVLTADIIINENVLDAEGNLPESTENLLVWSPIGLNWSTSFYGTFDGQGHTVSGIYINSENDYQGLFGHNEGTIKNIGVTESYIKGSKYVGGICGYNYGTISNCYNSGTINGNKLIGGVCGLNNGTISNCYNTATVSGGYDVGGVCGDNEGSISNCYNSGNVSGNYVGGVCGDNDGSISNCYNSGNVSGNYYVGGVCGYNNYDGSISNCYNSGEVSGNSYIGGVCGRNYDTISNCYYLQGTATGGINGNDERGQAEVKTAEQFASGEVCWLLNESSDENPVWFQTLYTDDYPVLDDAHNIVYAKGNCPNDCDNTYSNQGPSQVGAHTDNDNDGRCDFCEKIMTSEPAQKDGVYQISNLSELYWFAGLVNGTLSGVEQNNSANAVLTADIIINENVLEDDGNLTANTEDLLVWNPIGKNYDKTFRGTFDGQGHTVSGVYINTENPNQGLFGYNSGTIKNAGVTESYIKGGYYVGSVCGYNDGTISNCYNSGTVSGNDYVGGVCGYNEYGTISNCYNSGTVSGDRYVGGVCGDNSGTISNCYNSGTVNGSDDYVGGMCGYNWGSTISNCYYLQGTAEGGIDGNDESGQAEVKTAEQFASGEVCWLLNEEQSEGAWGQKLGTDPCPVLGGPAVFKDGETYYNEEGSAIVETNSEQASFVIVSENLTINIYGSDGEATVYNLAGNIVYQGIERIIPVQNPGMYMVRIGNEVQKTVVR